MPLDRNAPATTTRKVVRAACPHDCPDTCALEITVEDGRAIKVDGAADHPTTQGVLCTKVARYLDRRASHWIRELIICGAIGVVELHDAGALEKSSERRRLMVKIRKALADLAPDRGPTG